jgi:hypothetical protein
LAKLHLHHDRAVLLPPPPPSPQSAVQHQRVITVDVIESLNMCHPYLASASSGSGPVAASFSAAALAPLRASSALYLQLERPHAMATQTN